MCLPGVHEEHHLTIHSDMTAVVTAMANPESGLEVRDRMWLKITIANAFIGEKLHPHQRNTNQRVGGAWLSEGKKSGPLD